MIVKSTRYWELRRKVQDTSDPKEDDVDSFLDVVCAYDDIWRNYVKTFDLHSKIVVSKRLMRFYDDIKKTDALRGHVEVMYLAFYYGIDYVCRHSKAAMRYREENKRLKKGNLLR